MKVSQRVNSAVIFTLFILGGLALELYSAYLVPISITIVGLLLIALVRFFWRAETTILEKSLYITSLVLFYSSGIAFFIFLERSLFQYVLLFGVASIGVVYLENAYKYLWKHPDYQVSALSNVSSYMHLLTIFFATVSLFDLRFFFGVSTLVLLLVAGVFGVLLFYCYLWSQKVLLTSSRWYAVLFDLLFVQLIYVLNIWPHVPLVKGVVTLAFAYAMMQILLLSLRDALQVNKVMRILGITSFILLIVLITAQWR